MTQFDCFVAGSWMFVLGWYAGAIFMQNHNEKKERSRPRLVEIAEPCTECEAWRLPVAASASAD